MKKRNRIELLLVLLAFISSVSSFADLSDDALRVISNIKGNYSYEVLKRTIPTNSNRDSEIAQYMILVASNDKLDLSSSVTSVQIKSRRSWKTLMLKTGVVVGALLSDPFFLSTVMIGFQASESALTQSIQMQPLTFEDRRMIASKIIQEVVNPQEPTFYSTMKDGYATLRRVNWTQFWTFFLQEFKSIREKHYRKANVLTHNSLFKAGYLILDSVIRRKVDLGQSWLKFLFPMGYFSNQSQVNSSMTEIQQQMLKGNQEVFITVKKNLFQSIKAQAIKKLGYIVVE